MLRIKASVPFRVSVEIGEPGANDIEHFDFEVEMYRDINTAGATNGWGVLNVVGDDAVRDRVGRAVMDSLMDFAATLGKE